MTSMCLICFKLLTQQHTIFERRHSHKVPLLKFKNNLSDNFLYSSRHKGSFIHEKIITNAAVHHVALQNALAGASENK